MKTTRPMEMAEEIMVKVGDVVYWPWIRAARNGSVAARLVGLTIGSLWVFPMAVLLLFPLFVLVLLPALVWDLVSNAE